MNVKSHEKLQHVIKELGCDCNNPRQCWEPCGELGHSEEHARVATDAESAPRCVKVRPSLYDELVSFLEQYEDTRDGSDGRPLPNTAMQLLTDLRLSERIK